MTKIIITVSSRPETKSVKNDFTISHFFSQIKAAKLVIMELITFSSKYWQWQSDFYFFVKPLCLKDSLITHVAYARQNPAQFSHLLPQKELQITFLWLNRETAWKMLTQNFLFPNGKEIETDPAELSRRQENKWTKCSVVVKSTKSWVRLPTYKSWLYHYGAVWFGGSYLTSLCSRILICKIRIIIVSTVQSCCRI